MSIELAEILPTVDEYCALRIRTGLSAMDPVAAVDALPRSLHAVSLRRDGELVGMGRVVGDGLHVQVVDIAVHPDAQGQGLSRMIMENIMTFVGTLPRSTIVNLFADIDWLYQKFGFVVPEHTDWNEAFDVRSPHVRARPRLLGWVVTRSVSARNELKGGPPLREEPRDEATRVV